MGKEEPNKTRVGRESFKVVGGFRERLHGVSGLRGGEGKEGSVAWMKKRMNRQ